MTNFVVPLVDADGGGCGGKAALLAALVRAGLPVPDGFAVTHAAFAAAEVPAAIAADVVARAAALGRLAVRSSMSNEDHADGGAPGVFASYVDVPADQVWTAIRGVWASAASPLAIEYARRRGTAREEAGVVVQRFVPGARVTVYTRAPGRPDHDEVWIERAGDAVERRRRDDDDARVRLARAAEAAIGATRGADVELIAGDAGLVVVQARPIRHPQPPLARVPAPPPLFAFTRATPGVTWRWDAAHNPEPMSEAQAGLVELVDDPAGFPIALASASGGPVAPIRMRMVAGYLYWARREETGTGTASHTGADSELTVDELRTRWSVLDARMLAALDLAGSSPSLAAALDAYLAFYRIWAHAVSPLLAAARARLPAVLATALDGDRLHAERLAVALAGPRTTTVAARIAAAVRGDLDENALLAAIGDLSPAWDVAAPTFAEQPAVVRDALDRARRRAVVSTEPLTDDAEARALLGARLAPLLALARLAGDLSELDDVRFARAQQQVRRALLASAPRGVTPDDVFWLPLAELASGALATLEPETLAARAAAARRAATRAARWSMPLSVVDGAFAVTTASALRGVGTGGRVVGAVARPGTGAVPPGSIAVVRAVTPALALALDDAAAIVAEHGGILDHGAALARELGIPCVTGCAGAWDALVDGQLVAVDGDAGTVTLA